ncbi:MAG: imidazole glycerol phosphate synthase subunit HisH [Candidatus Methylarchaceae archaeon HK01B]|nr:imidazole glycerol phosphate synthase subunit HisH [Candidatus Methylarchaceae archaeon HK01M]MCP8311478.1 imidazole glycerol phosphate synthase subunit HisH [Candidatus Methylarchaceae archaeon HK02M1]MCP8318450.1 imidazole glycerol phosphate synthase subunit HisH [Candidatus Methylarchaceae archaeon HK01B]
MDIDILDYGVGNLFSLKCALQKAGADPRIVTIIELGDEIDGLIMPGVGSFTAALRKIGTSQTKIFDLIDSGTVVLGICLGMQIFFKESEEGRGEGLGIIPGRVVKFREDVKIPHMGWNNLKIVKFNELIEGLADESYVYFVHSYYPSPSRRDFIITETDYGVTFPSILAHENLYGTQFHPEKSGEAGLIILRNFVKIVKR